MNQMNVCLAVDFKLKFKDTFYLLFSSSANAVSFVIFSSCVQLISISVCLFFDPSLFYTDGRQDGWYFISCAITSPRLSFANNCLSWRTVAQSTRRLFSFIANALLRRFITNETFKHIFNWILLLVLRTSSTFKKFRRLTFIRTSR